LLEAPDVWLWDVLFTPVTKTYSFEVSALAGAGPSSRLTLWLQGASDFPVAPDHHLRVYVNGTLLAETSWEGKKPQEISPEIFPGILQEGENRLEIENVGDTGAAYSMVLHNPDRAGDFEQDAEALASTVPAGKHLKKIYLSQLGTAAARSATTAALDEGASLLSYQGHGGIHLWADENFFNASDVGSLAPQARQPVLLTMNCLDGYFDVPYFNSLAEELLKADVPGASPHLPPAGDPALRLW
jgi:hypothetical protein